MLQTVNKKRSGFSVVEDQLFTVLNAINGTKANFGDTGLLRIIRDYNAQIRIQLLYGENPNNTVSILSR
ncbi:MAG: hypothetical protein A3D92_14550 [Bacteroidetes bacterium RIFCSPHIGHO2_02_FULL_44_7]|nr:MAG: hypothetical protein A3D92_14550 [Bacteroidetes bacterium RIFCSPHIGHO2_02_FULL_44_7]